MTSAYLPTRSLAHVGGRDATDFLHALITTDVEGLPEKQARPGALLTPQGKILFDFLIWRSPQGGFALETDASQRDALLRRLTMYKLRAAVDISPEPEQGVTVFWNDDAQPYGGVIDGAFLQAGISLSRLPGRHSDGHSSAYKNLRIAAGLAVSGEDFALQDAFPHDVLLDKNGGLSFKKGCYVGQEVVSRMQHRGTARRRVAHVTGEAALPPSGSEITAAGKPVGSLGSVANNQGLAIVRIDRVGQALAQGVPLMAGGVEVGVELPAWSGLSFPASADEGEP